MLPEPASVFTALDAYDTWRELAESGRARILSIAEARCPLPWLAEELVHKSVELSVLGRFDYPTDLGVPWPMVVVQAVRPARGQRPLRRVLLLVTLREGAWEVHAVQPKEVPWHLFKGERGGPAGVLNGDRLPA